MEMKDVIREKRRAIGFTQEQMADYLGVWPHFGTLCPQVGAQDEGRGLSYTPCLLMKPVLRLRLHATQ